MSPTASTARLRSTVAATDLAADETHGAAAKICCNEDAGGFPGWLPSTRLLGHWGRKAAAEMRGKGERGSTCWTNLLKSKKC